MQTFLSWFMGILAVLAIGYIIVWNIEHVVYFIKCFKVTTCSDSQCRFKQYCDKYEEAFTEEDWEGLNEMLKKFRNQRKNGDA